MPSSNLNKPPGASPAGSRPGAKVGGLARMGRYGIVGLSGVLVNLGALWTLTRWISLSNPNMASALAIECSIFWNFWLHDRWTFRDRFQVTARLRERVLRFHTVAAFGALLQWATFAGLNYTLACTTTLTQGASTAVCDGSAFERLVGAIAAPPEVGAFKFLSQLTGICLATLWNFMMNTRWTFRVERSDLE